MKKFFTVLFLSIPFLSSAQNTLNIEAHIDTILRKIHFDAMGLNVERMHYRSLDGNGKMPAPILEDMLEAEDLVYRWPGGATANFYHFFEGTAKGYGLLKEEVDAQDHPMRCDLPAGNPNCMSFEQTTPTNYIYNLLEYADTYYQKFNKKKRVVWLPNIFTLYLNNKAEIPKLDAFSSLEDARQAMLNGEITADFYKRLKDIVDVYDILHHHPTIDLEGIEYGNEFYFHQPTTGAKYNEVNHWLTWAVNESKYRAALKEHISYYRMIIAFYNKVLFSRGPKIATAAPVAIITQTGAQSNMHLLWNEGIRDSILPIIDGVIHHFYFKRNDGPRIDPRTAEDPGKAADLLKIKNLADNFIHVRIPRVDNEYEKFFKLTEKGKKMWMTEFNTDNGYFDGYFAEWQNSFFHCYFQFEAFVSFIDNEHNTDVIKYAFPHLWVSHINDYNYGAYAAKTELNGTFKKIKRTTYSTYSILGSLAKREIKQINFKSTNADSLIRQDLYTRVYFEPGNDPGSKEIGKVIVLFSNKSGKTLQFNPKVNLKLITDSLNNYTLNNGYVEYLSAEHIYSSNGYTMHDSTGEDVGEDINVEEFNDVDVEETLVLPGYSLGYLAFPVIDENKVPTSVKEAKNNDLIELYPNPAKNLLTVTLKKSELFDNRTKWMLIDAAGKSHAVAVKSQNGNLLQLDVSRLASGVYQFVLQSSGGQKTASFIKQ